MAYKTMFIAQDLQNESDRIRCRATFENDPAYIARDKQEADRLMNKRRDLLTSSGLVKTLKYDINEVK